MNSMKRLSLLFVLLSLPLVVCAQTPQATPPPPAPPRSGTFPKPVEETLPNGLRVIVIQRSESPLVSAQLLIKNGGEVDPPELAGLARSEEHTSELQSQSNLVCRLLLEKKKKTHPSHHPYT